MKMPHFFSRVLISCIKKALLNESTEISKKYFTCGKNTFLSKKLTNDIKENILDNSSELIFSSFKMYKNIIFNAKKYPIELKKRESFFSGPLFRVLKVHV